jgi:(1->4)-alpha-D-glucan 1-alpha-D-glucosylmutase
VIIPKLGDPLDDVVDAGGLQIDRSTSRPEIRYGPLRFPMAAGTADLPLRDALDAQHYTLQWWRDPARNVRRFFTIDDLAAVCVEHEDVARTVDTIPRLLRDHPAFAGVRVDHVDVEKILAPRETLPARWPVDGTTGYEHVTVAEHALLDPSGRAPLDRLWRDVSGDDDSFGTVEDDARRAVLAGGLRPDLERVVRSIQASGSHRADRHTAGELRDAVVELTLGLDRYRTYLPRDEASDRLLSEVTDRAIAAHPDLELAIGDLANVISVDADVQTRWQQLTGPVMAKGAEDRAFYQYLRLASLCEVGGTPGAWTVDAAAFHDHHRRIQAGWPRTMLTDTTHDTKRSGAVRARSLALAARAEEWVVFVRSWLTAHAHDVAGPSGRDILLALQTAVTAAPIDATRLGDYLVKAAREAELSTNWTEPDDAYESALRRLAARLAHDVEDLPPGASAQDATATDATVGAWAATLRAPGAAIGLRLLALQLTCPGVPDLYQGAPAELLSLVDPDNRRPPDWATLSALVDGAGGTDVRSASARAEHDLARTVLTRRLLDLRRRRPGAFGAEAGYVPLATGGTDDAHDAIAYARTERGEPVVAVVVTRARIHQPEGAIVTLPDGTWRSLLEDDAPIATGGGAEIGRLVGDLGLVVLDRTDR